MRAGARSNRSSPIPPPPTIEEPRINDRIRAREVRLVAADGEQVGIKPLPEALSMARDQDLDLVEVAPQANPPVCKIMDYGKFKYEAAQRAKESRRKTTHVAIKEMKYRVKIGPGDFETKTKQVERFLGEGHKVKLTIMFRGREVAHPELGMKILERVAAHNDHLAKVEAAPRLDGRNMIMVLAPDRRVQEAARRQAEADGAGADADAGGAETDAGATSPAPLGAETTTANGAVPVGNGTADQELATPVAPAAPAAPAAAPPPPVATTPPTPGPDAPEPTTAPAPPAPTRS